MKAKNKTTKNEGNVEDFIASIDNKKRKEDALKILAVMQSLLPDPPKMWGTSIIGFGDYHYKYKSGREGDFFKSGFSPRKTSLTIYVMPGFEQFDELMSKLGKYTTGKSCLYIKKLEDIDIGVLKELIMESYNYMTNKYS